jgi:O-antigen/teichoic acid export membrane protein
VTKNLKSDTIKADSWNFSNMWVGQVRNLEVSVILARLLMPEDFGLLGMAMVFAGLTDAFVDFGFGNAIIRTKYVSKVQLSTVFWINMVMALVLSLIMFVSAPLVAYYFEMPQLKLITQVMSTTFLIKGLSALQSALFKKKLDYKTPFKIGISAGIISGIIGVFMAYTGYGVYSLIVSQIVGWIISAGLMWYFSTWRPSTLFDLKEVKDLWNFGYKYSLSIFIDTVFSRLDTIIIGKVFSAATLGLFYKAQSLNKMVIQYSFAAFSGVLFPSLSLMADDRDRLLNSMQRILHLVCFTTFLFAGLMYINAEEIIVLLLTDKWIESVPIFQILGLFSFIFTVPTIINAPILSIGESGAILKVELAKKTLYLFSIPVAIYFGLYAYIIATVVAAIIGMMFNLWLLKTFFNFKLLTFFKIFFRYAILFTLLLTINEISPNISNNFILHLILYSIIYSTIYIFINAKILKTEGFREFFDVIKPTLRKVKILK